MKIEFSSDQIIKAAAGTMVHIFRAGKRWITGSQLSFYAKAPALHKFRPTISVPSVQEVILSDTGFFVDSHPISGSLLELFAQRGGYESTAELLASFGRQRRPIIGQVVHWTEFNYLPPTESAPPATIAGYLADIVAAVAPDAREAAYAYLLALAEHLNAGPECTPANVVTALADPVGSTWHPELTEVQEWPKEALQGLWKHASSNKKGKHLHFPPSPCLALVA